MTTVETDRLIDDYLTRLEEAAAHLQRSRRAELIAEIREHIEAALREEDTAGEVAVRNVLDRLGHPRTSSRPRSRRRRPSTARGKLEVAAMIARRAVHRLAIRHRHGPDLQSMVEPRQEDRNGPGAAGSGSLPRARDHRQLLGERVQHARGVPLRPVGDRRLAERRLPRPALRRAE